MTAPAPRCGVRRAVGCDGPKDRSLRKREAFSGPEHEHRRCGVRRSARSGVEAPRVRMRRPEAGRGGVMRCSDLCARQGRGRPLPVSPTPRAICDWPKGRSTSTEGAQATTVHGMRTCLRKKVELRDRTGPASISSGKNDSRNRASPEFDKGNLLPRLFFCHERGLVRNVIRSDPLRPIISCMMEHYPLFPAGRSGWSQVLTTRCPDTVWFRSSPLASRNLPHGEGQHPRKRVRIRS